MTEYENINFIVKGVFVSSSNLYMNRMSYEGHIDELQFQTTKDVLDHLYEFQDEYKQVHATNKNLMDEDWSQLESALKNIKSTNKK